MLTVFKQHKWKSSIILSVIVLLLCLPYILQFAAKSIILDYTKPYGIQQVTIADLKLNLFTGKIQLNQLNLYKTAKNSTKSKNKNEQSVIHIGEFGLNFGWLGLFEKRISIQSLSFKDAKLPFRLDNQNRLFLANIPLFSESKTNEKTKDQTNTSLLPGLDKIDLHNIQLSLEHESKTTTFTINDLRLNHLFAWSNNYGRLQLSALVNESPVHANLQLHLFSEQPKVVGTFKANKLDLAKFAQFNENNALSLKGLLTTDITFTLSKTEQGPILFEQGLISLNDFTFVQKQIDTQEATTLAIQSLNWNGDVQYKGTSEQDITLDGTLGLQQLQAQKGQQKIDITKTALAGKTQVTLDKTISINTNQKLNLTALKLQDLATKQALSSDILATLNSQISIDGDKFTLNHNGDLTVKNLSASQQNLLAKLQQLNWQGNLNVSTDKELEIDSKGNLNLNQFALTNNKVNTVIAQSKKAQIKQINVKNLNAISLSDIRFTELKIGQKNKIPGLVNLQNISLNHADYNKQGNNQSVNLGKITINGSQTHISVDKEGSIAELQTLLAALPGDKTPPQPKLNSKTDATQTDKSPKKVNENTQKSTFNYQLAGLKIKGNNPVYITDNQLKPALKQTLQLKSFTLDKIASDAPQKITNFSVNVAFDEFSHLVSKGTFTPLKPTHELQAQTSIDSLSLVPFSGLSENKIGYQITSGQLSADLKTTIKDNKIDAINKLDLNKFELQTADTNKSSKFEKGFPVPLKTGLAMLQDKNDNIKLSLPIKGDLNNPDFNINDIISTALGGALAGATRTYLLLALQPFGAIALAGEYALDKASAITLQPVNFDNGSNALSTEMQSYLGKIKTLLNERKAIQIKLCGGVTEADRQALKQTALKAAIEEQAKQNKTDKNQDKKLTIPDIKISDTELLNLASKRQKAIKRYLLKIGTASKQVLICKPEIVKNSGSGSAKSKTNGQVKLTI